MMYQNFMIAVSIAMVLCFMIPFVVFQFSKRDKKTFKRTLVTNLVSFAVIMLVTTVCTFGGVFAEPAAAEAAVNSSAGWAYLAAALSTGLAAIGAGIAVAAASSAALGAISEDPKIMGKALIFVALAEGIALYGLLISFTILGRV